MGSDVWVAERVSFEAEVVAAMEREGDPALAELDDDALVEQFRVQASEIAAAQCRWLLLLAEIVVRCIWAREGAKTPTQWLSWAVSMADSTAREHVRVALRLADFPQLTERFAAGRISYTKVRAITRWGHPDLEELLLTYAEHATGSQLEEILRGFHKARRVADEQDGVLSPYARRQLRAEDLDGQMMRLTLEVPTDLGLSMLGIADRWADAARAEDLRAAKAQAEADGEPDRALDLEPPLAYRADAVVAALEALAVNGTVDTSGLERHTLVLHLDADELAAAEAAEAAEVAGAAEVAEASEAADEGDGVAPPAEGDGVARPAEAGGVADRAGDRQRPVRVRPAGRRATSLPLSAVERLLCTAGCVAAVHDRDGDVVGISGKNRQVPPRLLRALHARDGGRCRFTGCTQTRWVQAHHIVWRSDDGPTVLENLALLCARHHHLIHDEGWEVLHDGKGHFRFQPPDDSGPLPTVLALPGASADAAAARNGDTVGRDLKALQPDWDGQPPDYVACVDILFQELERLAPPLGLAA